MSPALWLSSALIMAPAGGHSAAPSPSPTLQQVVITDVDVRPRHIRPGGRVRLRFGVRNRSAVTAPTQAPRPGTGYRQGEGWKARGFDAIPGRFRVGVALSGPRGRETLYRWGFGTSLRPLQFRRITGYLRLTEPGVYTLYPAMIREGDGERAYRSVGLVRVAGANGRFRTVAYRILVDGREAHADVPPKLIGATIMVPLRFIAEALGATVQWERRRKRVVIQRSDHRITTRVGSHSLRHDGRTETIYQPARIIHGRIFVPLRAVGYALGAGVEWDGRTRTVQVHTGARPGPVGPL